MTGIIINPVADKQAKEKARARQMDTINLARNIVIQSAAGRLIGAHEAFERAEAFKAEEERRFPKDITDE